METTPRYESGESDLRTAGRVIEVRQLLCSSSEIRLRHNGQEYRLRLTRNNKLILTK